MTFSIDFMRFRFIAMVLSGVMLVIALVAFGFLGINRGLDFTGGVLVELAFEEATSAADVRDVLVNGGYDNAVVQKFGSELDVGVRVPPTLGMDQSNIGQEIIAALETTYPGVALRRSEFVGPAVGQELTEKGGLALLVALAVVMVYIMLRFTGKFAIGAVIALVHDVLIVIGLFAVFRLTFNLTELAALLAVIGYSLNDTIVVSDRIRENFRAIRRRTPIQVINTSLNQTLNRTLVTSITTLLVLVALLVAGGEQVFGFALALTIGVIVGTYSSIFVAATTLLLLKISSEDLAVPAKQNADDEL